MKKPLTRRGFLAAVSAATATAAVRTLPALAPRVVTNGGTRRILTLVYDRSLGMMRAIERVVH